MLPNLEKYNFSDGSALVVDHRPVVAPDPPPWWSSLRVYHIVILFLTSGCLATSGYAMGTNTCYVVRYQIFPPFPPDTTVIDVGLFGLDKRSTANKTADPILCPNGADMDDTVRDKTLGTAKASATVAVVSMIATIVFDLIGMWRPDVVWVSYILLLASVVDFICLVIAAAKFHEAMDILLCGMPMCQYLLELLSPIAMMFGLSVGSVMTCSSGFEHGYTMLATVAGALGAIMCVAASLVGHQRVGLARFMDGYAKPVVAAALILEMDSYTTGPHPKMRRALPAHPVVESEAHAQDVAKLLVAKWCPTMNFVGPEPLALGIAHHVLTLEAHSRGAGDVVPAIDCIPRRPSTDWSPSIAVVRAKEPPPHPLMAVSGMGNYTYPSLLAWKRRHNASSDNFVTPPTKPSDSVDRLPQNDPTSSTSLDLPVHAKLDLTDTVLNGLVAQVNQLQTECIQLGMSLADPSQVAPKVAFLESEVRALRTKAQGVEQWLSEVVVKHNIGDDERCRRRLTVSRALRDALENMEAVVQSLFVPWSKKHPETQRGPFLGDSVAAGTDMSITQRKDTSPMRRPTGTPAFPRHLYV